MTRRLDPNRKHGTVHGEPGVSYWQDGCFFNHEGEFVRAESPEKLAAEEAALEAAMGSEEGDEQGEKPELPPFEYREPGSPAYKEAYREIHGKHPNVARAQAARAAQVVGGSYNGEPVVVYNGSGSHRKNCRTVAMFKLNG